MEQQGPQFPATGTPALISQQTPGTNTPASSSLIADSSREGSSSARLQDASSQQPAQAVAPKKRRRRRTKAGELEDPDDEPKRRVVSTACVACRKRKSKCDGNTPSCAACSQVYNTQCIYDPGSDHRRKGVYRQENEAPKPHESTLNTIVQAILNYPEDQVPALVRKIRTCDNLDAVAAEIASNQDGMPPKQESDDEDDDQPEPDQVVGVESFETQLGRKFGELRMDDGSVRYIGGTSHLLFLDAATPSSETYSPDPYLRQTQRTPILSWTTVTTDVKLITHLVNLYFTWHYSYFTCLSRPMFEQAFLRGRQSGPASQMEHCSPLLVNAILALGCHFTAAPAARSDPADPTTAGDHFFAEAKRLILENDEHEKPRLTTVQALALMSVREAGCGREARGWVYSGQSFRMACDMGLHLDSGLISSSGEGAADPAQEDARRITFWGCFLFDKCWSNYLGRLPQLPSTAISCPKPDVFPGEDSMEWIPYGDNGPGAAHRQPARTRAVSLQISALCDISSDLMRFFYNPASQGEASRSKEKHAELKKLGEIEIRLESWRKNLPREMEPRDGALPAVFIMHMFFQLLHIHLFRPFLKYTVSTSPLPATVSPRKHCTAAATALSRLVRLYKRTYGLRQICNICVYMIHTASTIHLLNLPDRDARRDMIYGVKHLEEIAESWPCAGRTLGILDTLARQWRVDLPSEALDVLDRTRARFTLLDPERRLSASLSPSIKPERAAPAVFHPYMPPPPPQQQQQQQHVPDPAQWAFSPPTVSGPGYIPAPPAQRPVFGGVDQLLQDVGGARPVFAPPQQPPPHQQRVTSPAASAADWTFVDQQSFGPGFENWPYVGEPGQGATPGSGSEGWVGGYGMFEGA